MDIYVGRLPPAKIKEYITSLKKDGRLPTSIVLAIDDFEANGYKVCTVQTPSTENPDISNIKYIVHE